MKKIEFDLNVLNNVSVNTILFLMANSISLSFIASDKIMLYLLLVVPKVSLSVSYFNMKIFKKNRNNIPGILKNTVDKDVQAMLLPLNLMQYFSFCPKYRITNNVITSNGVISNFVFMTVTLIFILSFVFRTYKVDFFHKDAGAPIFFYITSYHDTVYYLFRICYEFRDWDYSFRNFFKIRP